MTLPLKIVVCSLKSIKQLFGVQNDSPVMNTPGSRLLSEFFHTLVSCRSVALVHYKYCKTEDKIRLMSNKSCLALVQRNMFFSRLYRNILQFHLIHEQNLRLHLFFSFPTALFAIFHISRKMVCVRIDYLWSRGWIESRIFFDKVCACAGLCKIRSGGSSMLHVVLRTSVGRCVRSLTAWDT
jgi:hypothetical protein